MRKTFSISLNEKDYGILQKVNQNRTETGLKPYGVTEIFRRMLYAIEKKIIPSETRHEIPTEE